MKVCYVLSTAGVTGGANRSLLELIQQIDKTELQFDCFVISNGEGAMVEQLKKAGIKCYVLRYARAIRSSNPWKTFAKRAYNLYARMRIRAILANEGPDILHNNSLPTTIGMEVALKMSIPYICHVRENVWSGLGYKFYSSGKVRKVMNHASNVICISNYVRKSYEGFYQNDNTQVLPDGIDIENYLVLNREILQGVEVRLLMVGTINPQKGQRDAVLAVERLSGRGYSIVLTIMGKDGIWEGSSEYAYNLREYVKQRGLSNVRFLDFVEDIDELKRIRNECDINLVCSSAEGLGRTTIEGMLSGSLTIASDAGATPEIIRYGKTGLLYETGNADDLADQIEWALCHREQGREIAQSGQEFAVKQYSIVSYANKIYDIYQKITLENKVNMKIRGGG